MSYGLVDFRSESKPSHDSITADVQRLFPPLCKRRIHLKTIIRFTRHCRFSGIGLFLLFRIVTVSPAWAEVPLADLTEMFRCIPETRTIDLDANSSLDVLASGWSEVEKSSGRPARIWSTGSRSELRPLFLKVEDRLLRFECEALRYPEHPNQTLKVTLNDRFIEQFDLSSEGGLEQLQAFLPSSQQVPGENHLSFEYGYHESPSQINPRNSDLRSLAVRFDQIQFMPTRCLSQSDRMKELSNSSTGLLMPNFTRTSIRQIGPSRWSVFFRSSTECVFEATLRWQRPIGTLSPDTRVGIELRSEGDREPRALLTLNAKELQDTESRRIRIDLSPYAGQLIDLTYVSNVEEVSWDHPTLLGVGEEALFDEYRRSRSLTESIHRNLKKANTDPPPIFIYLIDTLRYEQSVEKFAGRVLMPNLLKLKEQGTTFDLALSHHPSTKPSVASLFTGAVASAVGLREKNACLPDSVPTLAGLLSDAGYFTSCFVTNGFVTHQFNLVHGFEKCDYLPEDETSRDVHQKSWILNKHFLSFLKSHRDPRPLFAYLHATDPHSPYSPKKQTLKQFNDLSSNSISGAMQTFRDWRGNKLHLTPADRDHLKLLYRAESFENDSVLGEWLDHLRHVGLFDKSLIIIVADHGEEFLEHGDLEHARTLYPEQLHVPLVVKWPGNRYAGKVISTPVQMTDILPSVLDVAGVPIPSSFQGIPLRALLESEQFKTEAEKRIIYGEINLDNIRRVSVHWGSYLAIANQDLQDSHNIPCRYDELYQLDEDPNCRRNLADEYPCLSGYLLQIARYIQQQAAKQASEIESISEESLELDPAMEKRLKALGYLK